MFVLHGAMTQCQLLFHRGEIVNRVDLNVCAGRASGVWKAVLSSRPPSLITSTFLPLGFLPAVGPGVEPRVHDCLLLLPQLFLEIIRFFSTIKRRQK